MIQFYILLLQIYRTYVFYSWRPMYTINDMNMIARFKNYSYNIFYHN